MSSNILVGKKTLVVKDKTATIDIKGKLSIDARNDGQFFYYSSLRLLKKSRLKIEGDVNFFSGLQLKVFEGASVEIEAGTYFSGPIVIHAKERITIGKQCSIAWNCTIIDSNFHEVDEESGIFTKEVIIGDKVWLGNNVTILPGTVLQDNVIVGAQSVVKGICEENGIYAGNPAKLIRFRKNS